jgi:hypothetical protein
VKSDSDTRKIRVFPLKLKNNLPKFATIFHYYFSIFTDSFTDSAYPLTSLSLVKKSVQARVICAP